MLRSPYMAAASKGKQPRPEGALITIDADERVRLRELRKKRGWQQGELAKRIGVTPSTISNIETGRYPQVRKSVYAALLRALRSTGAPDTTAEELAVFRELVDNLVDLGVDQQRQIIAIVQMARKPR